MTGIRYNPYNARLTVAALAAPVLGASLVAIAYAILVFGWNEGTSLDATVLGAAAGVGALFGVIIGFPAMLLGGMPIHAALMSVRMHSIFAYLPGGAATGALAAICFSLMRGWDELFAYAALGAATGAVCAGLFWLIRRPDRAA